MPNLFLLYQWEDTKKQKHFDILFEIFVKEISQGQIIYKYIVGSCSVDCINISLSYESIFRFLEQIVTLNFRSVALSTLNMN